MITFRCLADLRKKEGPIINNILAIALLVTFGVNLGSYVMVWIRLRHSASNLHSFSRQQTYNRTGRIMMLFVVVFLMQWLSIIVYNVWSVFGLPSVSSHQHCVLCQPGWSVQLHCLHLGA